MKRSVLICNRYIVATLDLRKFAVALLLAPVLLTTTEAIGANGELRIGGSLVNPSCAVLTGAIATGLQSTQRVKVTEDMQINVDTFRNACSEQSLPFTAQYRALPVPVSDAKVSKHSAQASGSGILTLTYE
jgi:type 1 fimbria pilin